jgi:histone acetyltransferase 1
MGDSEFVTKANECIKMRWCKRVQDIRDIEFYNPTFTHQIFGEDELIKDYKEATLDVYYNAGNLQTWIDFSFKNKLSSFKQASPLEKLTKYKITFQEDGHGVIPFDYPVLTHQSEFVKTFQPFTPIGFSKQISSYTVNGSTFELFHGTFASPKLVEYHKRMQTFSLFFIQTTSYLDESDPKWNIFMLFEKYKGEKGFEYAFVGYSSVYPFYAYPENQRLRISQFVIIPPYQKGGHGGKLLSCIYEYGKQNNAIEVCVEDPAEEFQALRDKIDLILYKKLDVPIDTVWSKEFFQKMRNQTKLTEGQLYMCYELCKLEKVMYKDSSNLKRDFEKEMKRKIMKEYDLLAYYPDKTECKQKLEEIYQFKMQGYRERIKK